MKKATRKRSPQFHALVNQVAPAVIAKFAVTHPYMALDVLHMTVQLTAERAWFQYLRSARTANPATEWIEV